MRATSLLIMSVSIIALLAAVPAHSQPAPGDAEAELIGLHQLCDGGDRQACIRFGFILGQDSHERAEWRRLHPEWWSWDRPAAPTALATPVANITVAPPELPVYEQPPIPAPGYIWTPGYWAYGSEGYYWVPGTWVQPPTVGLLWTPGYWGWRDGVFVWNAGYWGPRIGFYGGIDYGFGYTGVGYAGGRWNNGVFVYNETVNNFGGVRITNVYSETVVVRTDVRVSFNGGNGGIEARPTPQEEAASREQHTPPTPEQDRQHQMASTNKALLASTNHGQPSIAATAKPGEFSGKGVVAAREAPRGGTSSSQPPTSAKPPMPNPTAARPPEPNPNEVKRPEPGPSEAKRSEPNPNEIKKSLPGPNEAKRPEPTPNEAKKPEAAPNQAKRPEPKPSEVIRSEANPSGAKPPEKKEAEPERATLNDGTPPKPPSVSSKPIGGPDPTQPPKPRAPQRAEGPTPHPAIAAHPPGKPARHPEEKKRSD